MKLSARCPSCEKTVEVGPENSGQTLRCPECRARYTVLGIEDADPVSGEVPILPYVEPPLPGPHRGRDPLPGRRGTVRPWVRLWARLVDWWIWKQLMGVVLMVSGLSPGAEEGSPWTRLLVGLAFHIVALMLWVPVEAFLLSRWGTTPGKWLLRVRVTNGDGSSFSFERALLRSWRVFVRGMALGIWFVEWAMWIVAWRELRRGGQTRWDAAGAHRITHYRVGVIRTAVAITILIGIDLARTYYFLYIA